MADNSAAGNQPSPIPVIHQGIVPANCSYPDRAGYEVKVLVRHNTVGSASLGWFQNPASGVSIQHLINRDGSRTDMVRRSAIAFHCGESKLGNWSGSVHLPSAPGWPDGCDLAMMNAISIGMEFESRADVLPHDRYTDAQYWTGAYTEACTVFSYKDLVVTDHKRICIPWWRRRDPAWFDYKTYMPRVDAWLRFLQSVPAVEVHKYIV